MNFFDVSFWQDFVSNLLATAVGVALGIPVAFWINRRVEANTELDKRRKIIEMISIELNKNRAVLQEWQQNGEKHWRMKMYGALLSDEVWNSFSDGGEIQWIKDTAFLGTLAEAYGEIKRIKYLYDIYLHWNTLAVNAESVIRQDLESAVDDALHFTDLARKLIRMEIPNL